MWSPYCPGRLLIDCTTEQSRELRVRIAERVERGEKTKTIMAWIRSQYGDEAIARPDTRGSGLVVWLVPLAIFVCGACFVGYRIARWRSATTA